MTTKGNLPKAYLRLDPNIDQVHPDDLDGFVRLLCAAARQPIRGRFRDRKMLDALLGRRVMLRLLARGDIVFEEATDCLYVDGWDEWQEGDLTVGERQARIRQRRVPTVTSPLHDRDITVTEPVSSRDSPSEAVRQQGGKAEAKASSTARDFDPYDAYYCLTARTPSKDVMGWLDRLLSEHGQEPLEAAMAAAWAASPSTKDFMGRVEVDCVRSAKKRSEDAARRRTDAEMEYQRRMREEAESMPPEQRAANLARLKDELRKTGLVA